MSTDTLGTATEETPKTPAPWIPDDTDFGARLALVRWRMGWNIKEAAAACGVPAASWRLWELGGAQPRKLMVVGRQISSRTGVNLAWLVDGRELLGSGQTPYSARLADRPRPGRPPNRGNGPSGPPDRSWTTTDTRRPVRRANAASMAPTTRVA